MYQHKKDYNPALLKLELLSRGMKIAPSVKESLGKDFKEVLRVRTGAGCGVDLILEKEIYVIAHTEELRSEKSPFTLEMIDDEFYVAKNGEPVQKVKIFPRPKFYDKKTSNGVPMSKIGAVQGDFVSFSLDNRCWFWGHYEGENLKEYRGKQCKFCSIGLNWTTERTERPVKTIDQILEVCEEALKEKFVRHIGINAGTYPPPSRGHKEYAQVVRAIKESYDVWVRLSIAPPEEEKYVDLLYEAGADLVGYDLEVYDPDRFAYICPGKLQEIDKGVAHQHYERILKHASKTAGRDHVYSNILTGTEPRESTVKGIEYLSSLGVLPRVFIGNFQRGTPLENESVSSPEDLVYIYRNLKHIVEDTYHEDVGCAGCARIEVGTKEYMGINPRMPQITDDDLIRAGIDPESTY